VVTAARSKLRAGGFDAAAREIVDALLDQIRAGKRRE
jgi:hypothetical protein